MIWVRKRCSYVCEVCRKCQEQENKMHLLLLCLSVQRFDCKKKCRFKIWFESLMFDNNCSKDVTVGSGPDCFTKELLKYFLFRRLKLDGLQEQKDLRTWTLKALCSYMSYQNVVFSFLSTNKNYQRKVGNGRGSESRDVMWPLTRLCWAGRPGYWMATKHNDIYLVFFVFLMLWHMLTSTNLQILQMAGRSLSCVLWHKPRLWEHDCLRIMLPPTPQQSPTWVFLTF